MSLRNSIKDLRNVARRLNAAKFNPQMNELEQFLDGIVIDKPASPPKDDLKMLLQKFRSGATDFSAREIKNLPFIIYEPSITSNETKQILYKLDFSRASHLRRVMIAYLLNYDDSNKTEWLRQILDEIHGADSVSLKKIFAARDKLFAKDCFLNMTKFFAQKLSVKDALKELGLSDFYRTTNFIQTALKIFFRKPNLAVQLKILRELDAEPDAYKNIFPVAADTLIPIVDLAGKKICLEIFYRRLGDPRFGYTRFNWNGVSQKSKEIFMHWLSEDDLETFFNIVAQTSNDKQWSYREKFWRRYLPHIINTWIFLTGNAKKFAAQSKLSHGTLTNGDGNQAVFVFQIGEYIFSEWSNIGKVRAYNSSWQEVFFGRREISGAFIRKNFAEEWSHLSPQTNFWQREVGDWIAENC